MTTVTIRGVPVSFPFQPYDIQKAYMEKVIETLQNEDNAVLESPTGTGKTLALLCSSLAWLTLKKSQYQASGMSIGQDFLKELFNDKFNKKQPGATPKFMWDIPTIIYASRTHSQLTQAMQELKRTTYRHVKATVLGSREQMCIHPDVSKETNNANKTNMCRAMVKARNCHLQNRVEKMTCSTEINDMTVVDIEDLVKMGQKQKFCPYYMAKELRKQADIVFLPYNYLLDPKARRSQQIDLKNSIIILDEAHNVEHICEDSASFQIRTTDITLCIEEVTIVMKQVDENRAFNSGEDMDFTLEDLILLKTMLLNLEKVVDDIPINNTQEGSTYEGKYIFEILNKSGITDESQGQVLSLLNQLVQFLSTSRENPFQRNGSGLQMLQDLLLVVFQKTSEEFKSKINQCYKVHLIVEEPKKKMHADTWLSKATAGKSGCRVLSYWCFSPGFGMQMLIEQGVRSVILTSGTLAPLKPLISELGINVGVRLENPHVVSKKQICVKILSNGPDGTLLNASYQNRNNPQYISSLGMSILNISRMVPHGLLIFFPSYPVLYKCQEEWQTSEIWSGINQQKTIYVEPRTKDAFATVMKDFYARVKDPIYKGAIFMAVCRGKVSEGLDFADMNGRAVIVTGLPYPPLKDPRIVLKKNYLDILHARNKEDWYSLEASRAVNQAIGRVIRHQYDYGAILLLDSRFNSAKIKSQMSLWLRDLIVPVKNFGEIIRDLRNFFKEALISFPLAEKKSIEETAKTSNSSCCASSSSLHMSSTASSLNVGESGQVTIHKRSMTQVERKTKKKKFTLLQVDYSNVSTELSKEDMLEYINTLKTTMNPKEYIQYVNAIRLYRDKSNYENLIACLDEIFVPQLRLRLLLPGLSPYIKVDHKKKFEKYCENMR